MKKSLLIIAPVAMLALAACNKTETPAEGTEAEGTETAAAPVELPPAIVDSGAYRCGDGTVLYVDFYGNAGKDGAKTGAAISVGEKGKDTVRVEAPKAEAPADGAAAPAADAAAPAGPMKSADGEASLSGGGASINVKLPGKGAQTCKA
jgi:hypothetical protein